MNREDLKKLHKARAWLQKRGKFSGIADYCMVGHLTDDIIPGNNFACHAGLNKSHLREVHNKIKLFGIASGLQNQNGDWNKLNDKQRYTYLNWLLNDSPYASSFVSKSASYTLKTGVIMSSGYAPSNLMAGGLVASRRLWEYPSVAVVFCELVDRGVNANLAYLLGHIANGVVAGAHESRNIDWSAGMSAHCSVDMYTWDIKTVKNFINGDVKQPNKPYYESTVYNYYDKLFSEPDVEVLREKVFGTYVHKNFPYDACKDGVAKVNLNPFIAAKKLGVNTRRVPFTKAMDVMAKWSTELMEVIKNA